jgi:hypothetical protein
LHKEYLGIRLARPFVAASIPAFTSRHARPAVTDYRYEVLKAYQHLPLNDYYRTWPVARWYRFWKVPFPNVLYIKPAVTNTRIAIQCPALPRDYFAFFIINFFAYTSFEYNEF